MKFLLKILFGFALLFLVNFVGVAVGINLLSVLFVALLGLPAILVLILL